MLVQISNPRPIFRGNRCGADNSSATYIPQAVICVLNERDDVTVALRSLIVRTDTQGLHKSAAQRTSASVERNCRTEAPSIIATTIQESSK